MFFFNKQELEIYYLLLALYSYEYEFEIVIFIIILFYFVYEASEQASIIIIKYDDDGNIKNIL